MAKKPEIIMVAEASAEHPRNGGADLIELKDGSIFLVRMEAVPSSTLRHSADDEAPHDLVSMISRDGGYTWGKKQLLIGRGSDVHSAYTPGLLRLANGEVLFRYELYHRHVYGECMTVSALACTSTDECRTFGPPSTLWSRKEAHSGSAGDLRQLRSGRIIVPLIKMRDYNKQDEDQDHCIQGCFLSDDNGRTWRDGGCVDLPMRGAMEGKIEQLRDGRLLMVMRTQLGAVFRAYSPDEGLTWTKPQTTGLGAPESCPGLRRIPQTGDLLIIWNNSEFDPKFDHSGLRTPLTVAISRDEGQSWEKIKNIETEPDYEYTNPAAIVTRDGKILLSYEASKYESLTAPGHGNVDVIGRVGRERMHLKMAVIDLDWLYE